MFSFVVQFLRLQSIFKGLPGDVDCPKQSGVSEFIGRSAAYTKKGYDAILGIGFVVSYTFFVGHADIQLIISANITSLNSPYFSIFSLSSAPFRYIALDIISSI